MTKANENGAEKEQPKQYTILTDTIARSMKPGDRKLPDRTVKGLKLKPASRKGRGYWFLYYYGPLNKKKRSEMSLGIYPEVSIAEARERGNEARKLLAKGIDVTPNYHPVLIRASALLLPMWAGEARGCVA
jgi:hypothetical protein